MVRRWSKMDYFRSVTQSVLGTPQPGQQPSGAETVERLIDRVQSSTLLEDRRDGCRALKSMSRKYRVLVGAHGMDTLTQVLEVDRSDHEIVNYAVETLVNITSPETFQEEMEDGDNPSVSSYSSVVGEQFTEIFTKRRENIELLISLLDEYDFKVRYPAVKLLTNLLKNRPKDLQEVILVIPSGVSKLMDLLSDSREVVRNDALLLLTELTKSNTNLQKIVAFENGYDHIFEIIRSEGFADGGVVVEDCLILMLNLLRNNPSNQTFFKEGSYIQRLSSFFTLPLDSNEGWSAQKVTNIHYMLQLVRSLVAPQNPAQAVTSCQRLMNQCGLLQTLTGLLMASGVPVDILTDTINTVSDMIRGNMPNQEFFASMMAPSTPPRPAIVVLLMSMVNDKQPFVLRCAVLYCFQCFLYRNQTGQAQIIQTLLPQTADVVPGAKPFPNSVTAGQLLCSGLFSPDPVSNWFAAVALSHSLVDNPGQKENMLRVQLATSVGSPPVSLMQQCMSILQAGPKVLTRLGILMLLSTWLAHSPVAVQTFLAIPSAIPHLTNHVSGHEHDELECVCQGLCAFLLGLCVQFTDGTGTSFTGESLRQLVADRIGAEIFSAKLSQISRTEQYTKAVKSPQLAAKQPSDLVFDHEFCRLFKSLEVTCMRAATPQLAGGSSTDVSPVEVTKYKDIIRDQDAELTQMKEKLAGVLREMDELKAGKEQLAAQVQQLHDENTVLRVQQGISGEATVAKDDSTNPDTTTATTATAHASTTTTADTDTGTTTTTTTATEQQTEQLTQLQHQLAEMTHARDYYYYEMYKKDTELTSLQQQLQQLQQQQQQQSSEVQQQGQQGCGQQQTTSSGNQAANHLDNQNAADFFDSLSNPEMENLRKQLEDLQLVLYNKDSEIQQLKEAATTQNPQHNGHVEGETQAPRGNTTEAHEKIQQECKVLKQQVKDYEIHIKQLQTQLETAAAVAAAARAASVAVSSGSSTSAETRCKLLEEELDSIKREQEDLLVLVTDQDSKMSEYRRKLRAYGEDVTEDEDEDDEEGGFAISENFDDDLDDLQ